ncbi:transcriptional regulator [Pedobacter sp. HDW13]|uniref:transcriptional regulator n=1 Tax=unclassified Pedobacter TaxID=2628915 RepID=UPI000F5A3876|nr:MULTISPECIES: transcriptional regulator [unclassified Pedobacter]QIL38709.1 transcriptional regulator [Pedobacter sp. HDW13]RQO80130.1 transcriptional regulator [Pedobacter sp. KBW01]
METYIIEEDIKVLCITASSFPDGVLAAHQQLHALFPPNKQRMYFGISRPDATRKVIYKAAVTEMAEEAGKNPDLEYFTIKKGDYISELIPDFMEDVSQVGKTFEKLLNEPNIDPNGYCLEMYLNETDVRCMVGIQK